MAVAKRPAANRGLRLSREERRQHLLDVAADLVLEGGADAVTMEGVAAAAGVSKGLGYVYFANRADLLQALLEREREVLSVRTVDGLSAATTYEERIRATTAAWFDTVEERGVLLGALLQAVQIEGLQDARDTYYRGMQQSFGAMAAEEFGIPIEEAVTTAAIFISGLDGVLDRWIEQGRPRAEVEETYIATVLGGVRALAERTSTLRR